MQKFGASWLEIRNYEFPDEAPTHDEHELAEWIDNHPEAQGNWDHFAVRREVLDFELVTRENV